MSVKVTRSELSTMISMGCGPSTLPTLPWELMSIESGPGDVPSKVKLLAPEMWRPATRLS